MQEAASLDKSSPEYQPLSWDALRKSITGIVNRVNITNIKQIVPDLFYENLIRVRGLFMSIKKAQAANLPFTPVFAALLSSTPSCLKSESWRVGVDEDYWSISLGSRLSGITRLFFFSDRFLFLLTAYIFLLLNRLSFHNHLTHLVNQSLAHPYSRPP